MVVGHAWQGVCMTGDMHGSQKRKLQWAVHNLLECILVFMQFSAKAMPNNKLAPFS